MSRGHSEAFRSALLDTYRERIWNVRFRGEANLVRRIKCPQVRILASQMHWTTVVPL